MKSLTLSESLAEIYHVPTCGMAANRWRFVFDRNAVAVPTREQCKALEKRIVMLERGMFGARAFATIDRTLEAWHIAPEIGGTGWKRWPGADHWEVLRAGKTVFRTQSYAAVLKYFMRATGVK